MAFYESKNFQYIKYIFLIIVNFSFVFGQVGYNEEFQISDISGTNYESKIAILPNNRFVVFWVNYQNYIVGQIFNNDFTKVGNELLIDNETVVSEYIAVTGLSDGKFVVCWYHEQHLYIQIFNKNGSINKPKFKISDNYGSYPALTALNNNKFVIAWTRFEGQDGFVYAKIYNNDGEVYKDEFKVGTRQVPSMCTLSNGNFIICYRTMVSGSHNLEFQIFSNEGICIGEKQMISADGYGTPSITPFSDNKFAICWAGKNIHIKLFSEDGKKNIDYFESEYCCYDTYNSIRPRMTNIEDNLFITWFTEDNPDGDGSGILGLYLKEGKILYPEMIVNDYRRKNQVRPDVKALSDGKILVIWTSQSQIYGKYYLPEVKQHDLSDFSIISPQTDQSTQFRQPYFKWEKASVEKLNFPWELTYDLYISKTEDFQNPIIHREIEGTRYQLMDTLDQGQIYYWKVKAVNWEYDSLWCSNVNGFFVSNDAVTDIEEYDAIVDDYVLDQNYPNPFNPSTMINYQLAMTNEVELSVYDLSGKKISILVSDTQQTGKYSVNFDASGLSSGIYFYRLEVGGRMIDSKKMMVLK